MEKYYKEARDLRSWRGISMVIIIAIIITMVVIAGKELWRVMGKIKRGIKCPYSNPHSASAPRCNPTPTGRELVPFSKKSRMTEEPKWIFHPITKSGQTLNEGRLVTQNDYSSNFFF